MIKVLSAGLILLLFVACAGLKVGNIDLDALYNATQKAGDLLSKSEDEEIAIGRDIAGLLLKERAIENDSDLQRYVNLVGQWLAQHSERPDLPWRFAVLDDNSFNAYATPGGHVFVNRGTLMQLDSEAELAGVLAHEIAHVIKQHHLNAIKKQAQIGLAKDMASFFYTKSQEGTEANATTRTITKEVAATAENIYYNGLDKDDEIESDAMAVVIASRAGYDPYAFFSVLQKIEQQSADTSGFARFFESHPPPVERIEALDKVLSSPFSEYGHYLTLQSRYLKRVE